MTLKAMTSEQLTPNQIVTWVPAGAGGERHRIRVRAHERLPATGAARQVSRQVNVGGQVAS
jgi:hypothetical protein